MSERGSGKYTEVSGLGDRVNAGVIHQGIEGDEEVEEGKKERTEL